VAQTDLLQDVLELATRESALEGEALEAFVAALQERARLVVEERIERLESQARTLEREGAWRREAMAGLEQSVRSLENENDWQRQAMATLEGSVRSLEEENAWRREAVTTLETSLRTLEQEKAWRQEAVATLEREVERLRDEGQKAASAHEALLAHHREVLGRVVTEAVEVSSLPLVRLGQARRRLRALAELLRRETR
jgi:chromosome segregation ATPase